MSRNQVRSLWSRLWGSGHAPARKPARRLAIEALEDRAVPATVVTNLLDSTNASSPIAGSLRNAITRPDSDGIITFDPTLFSDAVGPQTLVLNGAVGRLQFNSSTPLTIQGPGKFASGPFAGQYKLIIQSDIGFLSASVTNGGQGFKIGDILQQGFDQFNGGARFQVLSINELSDGNPTNGKGAITSVSVIQPGANSLLRGTGAVLSPSGSGTSQLTPVGASTGSGAFLQVNPTEFGTATGLVQQQMTGGTSIITASGIHFGTARGDALIVGLGNLTVNDCRFSNTDKFGLPKQSTSYITVLNGGRDLSITNSTFFDSGSSGSTGTTGNNDLTGAVVFTGIGNLSVNGSVFDGNDEKAIEYANNGTVSIANSTFSNNGDGIDTSTGVAIASGGGAVRIRNSTAVSVTNSLFQNNLTINNRPDGGDSIFGFSALAVFNSGGLTVSNSTFDTNSTVDSGFRLIGEPDTRSYNSGGSAILSIGTPTVAISNSLFRNNSVIGIDQEDSGGGAIYNFNGTLNITQCGFENNRITITGYPDSSVQPDTTDYTASPELQPSARYSGGGALYSGGSTKILGSYFSDNAVESQVDFWQHAIDEVATPSKPLYSGGGALYLTSNGLATVNYLGNTTFTRNTAIQTAVTTDLSAAGRGATEFLPLGAIPSAVITMPGFFSDTIVTLNSLSSSYSVASPSFKTGYTVAPPVALPPTPAGGPGAIARGDFNNDGVFDFAIANPLVNTVAIYAGTVDPVTSAITFSLQTTLTSGTTVGAAPIALAVGDFDNDGNDDIASANAGENSLSVFLGTGAGTFGTASQVALPGTPVSIASGDFNGDGLDDVTALSSTGTISQLNWSNVSKSFANPVNSVFSGFPATIALGDINGDAVLDAVVAEPAANKIGVYLGQANGAYALNQSINTDNPLSFNNPKVATQPVVARLADLDGDGLVDLYAALKGTSDIFLLSNAGASKAGTFFPTTRTNNDYYGVLKSPVDVMATSATKLAPPNLAVASDSAATASILINNSAPGTPGISFVRRNLPSGKGLNGGAMIIADGRTPGNPNNVSSNSYNGSSNTSIVNCTITGNSLVNPFATSSNSNISTVRAQSSAREAWLNSTDTGGIFADVAAGSPILTTNALMNNNTGIRYLQQGPPNALVGDPVEGNTNAGVRNLSQGNVTFGSAGNSMYDPATCYGYNNPGAVGYFGLNPTAGDIIQSDSTANLDPAGLQTDVRAPQIGLTSNPAFAGRVKYIPIERLSPARDGGTSVNVYPSPLATDARGANRLININVDIGAFEVQYATQTSVQSPVLAPADSTHPNPFTFTTYGQQVTLTARAQWNDNKLPTEGIQGIIELVRSSDNVVVMAGTLVPVPGNITAGTVTLAINNNATNLLNTGTNTFYFRYGGDMNYATSQSSRFDIIVNPTATTATLAAPVPNPSGRFNAVAFSGVVTAPVSSQVPVGTIDIGYQLGSAPFVTLATGVAIGSDGTFSTSVIPSAVGLPYGVFNIIAKFNPSDSNQFSVSTSNFQSLTIGVTPSVTLASISPNPVQAGDAVAYSAIVLETDPLEPLTGSVDFVANGVVLGSVPVSSANPLSGGGGLQYTLVTAGTTGLNLGTTPVVARYNQDGGSYATTTSNAINITVIGYDTTTSVNASPTTLTYGSKVTLSATVSAAAAPTLGNGTVTFFQGSNQLGSGTVNASNPTATLAPLVLPAGTHLIDAAFGGDGKAYNPSTSNPVTVTVNPANAQATLTGSSVVSLGATTTFTTTLTPSVSGAGIAGLTGNVIFSISVNGSAPSVIGSVQVALAGINTYRASLAYRAPSTGNYIVSATYAGDSNFSSTITPFAFRVNRVVVQRFYAIAPAVGSTVQLFSTTTNTQLAVLRPIPNYSGGFRANTSGDVTGDGVADLVLTSRNTSFVRIYDGRTLNPLGGFFAYASNYPNPVNIATGDVNGDLRDDIIVAPGGTGFGPLVKVFNGANPAQVLWSSNVYSANYRGGVTVAAADVDNDGKADIITGPMTSSAANVRVFSGATGAMMQSFIVAGFGAGYTGGIWVAANVYTNGTVDIVTSANAGAPRVVATDYSTLATKANFLAFSSTYRGSIRVAMADTNGDGIKELLVGIGANGGGPLVARYTRDYQRIDQFFAFGPGNGAASFNGGIFPG